MQGNLEGGDPDSRRGDAVGSRGGLDTRGESIEKDAVNGRGSTTHVGVENVGKGEDKRGGGVDRKSGEGGEDGW